MAGSDSTPAIEFPITIIIDEEFELTTHRSAIEYSLVPSFPLGIGGAALLSRCFQAVRKRNWTYNNTIWYMFPHYTTAYGTRYGTLRGPVRQCMLQPCPKDELPSKTIPYYTLYHTLQLYMVHSTILYELCLVLCFIAMPLFTRESAAVGRAPSSAKPARVAVQPGATRWPRAIFPITRELQTVADSGSLMEELKNITPSCQLFRHRLRLRICRSARQRRRSTRPQA
jgi:hypothetical protein